MEPFKTESEFLIEILRTIFIAREVKMPDSEIVNGIILVLKKRHKKFTSFVE